MKRLLPATALVCLLPFAIKAGDTTGPSKTPPPPPACTENCATITTTTSADTVETLILQAILDLLLKTQG